jgi:Mg-chelatase subunit ChlD
MLDFRSPREVIAYNESDQKEARDNDQKAFVLTAGEISDFSKWDLWEDVSRMDLKAYSDHWKVFPRKRYLFQLRLSDGAPAIGAKVLLLDKHGADTLFAAMSDNTGKAELWADIFSAKKPRSLVALIDHNGQKSQINSLVPINKGVNYHELAGTCQANPAIDIAFMIDATSSMSDEIRYLKGELISIINRVKEAQPESDLRVATVFYRDEGDEYLHRFSPFTDNLERVEAFIQEQSARGGGDYPEAVIPALDICLNQLDWRENSYSKLLFMLLDAPPHHSPEKIRLLHEKIKTAAKKGVRIIPVAASGIDKSTEYLLRAMALATNGTYVFLTDHSGIGNPHLKPSTDSYQVELLNDLMVRLIRQFTFKPNCWEKVASEDPIESGSLFPAQKLGGIDKLEFDWLIYPNPTQGNLVVYFNQEVAELQLLDLQGKLLQVIKKPKQQERLDLSLLANGIYFLRFPWQDQWKTERIIVRH